jgi:hypothetical protein
MRDDTPPYRPGVGPPCLCDPWKNCYGRGFLIIVDRAPSHGYVINERCPIHGARQDQTAAGGEAVSDDETPAREAAAPDPTGSPQDE